MSDTQAARREVAGSEKRLTVIRIKRKRDEFAPAEILVDAQPGPSSSGADQTAATHRSKRQAMDQLLAELTQNLLGVGGGKEENDTTDDRATQRTSTSTTTAAPPHNSSINHDTDHRASSKDPIMSAGSSEPPRPPPSTRALSKFRRLRTVSIKDANELALHRELIDARKAQMPRDPGPSTQPVPSVFDVPQGAPTSLDPNTIRKEKYMERSRGRLESMQRAARYRQVQCRRETVGAGRAEGTPTSKGAGVQFIDVYELETVTPGPSDRTPHTDDPQQQQQPTAAEAATPKRERKKPSGLSRNPNFEYKPDTPTHVTMNDVTMVREKVTPSAPPLASYSQLLADAAASVEDEFVYDYYVMEEDGDVTDTHAFDEDEQAVRLYEAMPPIVQITDKGEWTVSDYFMWGAQMEAMREGDLYEEDTDSNAEDYYANEYPSSDEGNSAMDSDDDLTMGHKRSYHGHRGGGYEATYVEDDYVGYDPDEDYY